MKERPILFSAPMVRAILEGRKTQTRRVVRKQFGPDAEPAEVAATSPEGWQITGHSGLWWDDAGACIDDAIRCPYGKPGDRLFVRETWGYRCTAWHGAKPSTHTHTIEYRADGARIDFERELYDDSGLPKQRKCQPGEDYQEYYRDYLTRYWKAWRPSIHMPRWASRILLEVTSVRVERINDISAEDAIAEGIHHDDTIPFNGPWYASPSDSQGCGEPAHAYANLWESINGYGSWDANPWVWVVEFKRVAA